MASTVVSPNMAKIFRSNKVPEKHWENLAKLLSGWDEYDKSIEYRINKRRNFQRACAEYLSRPQCMVVDWRATVFRKDGTK
ncbi:MAG: hypothetical protein ACRD4B_09535 [Acidobacteriota bacterium]